MSEKSYDCNRCGIPLEECNESCYQSGVACCRYCEWRDTHGADARPKGSL